jgi:hypothetical protein
VARRLAVSTLCAGAVAVATLAPAHLDAAASAGAAPAATSQVADRAAGSAVSRGTQRSAPTRPADAAGNPVLDVTPASPPASTAPAAPAGPADQGGSGHRARSGDDKAAAPPTHAKRPAAPRLPAIAGLDIYQRENAQTIVNVGREMGVSERGQIIAVATALQESRLYNLYVAVDHDSLGLFQQRPSTGWGTPDEINTPSYAARAFYARLLDTTADWGCLTCAAQRVQGSAFPDAYAAQEWFATDIVGAFYRN